MGRRTGEAIAVTTAARRPDAEHVARLEREHVDLRQWLLGGGAGVQHHAAGRARGAARYAPGREAQPLHPSRGHEPLGLEHLEVETDAEAAAKAARPCGVRDQMEPAHDDRHLGLERLGRRRLEKAERGVAAVDAIARGAPAAAADHWLD